MKNLIYTLLTICLASIFSLAQDSNLADSILYVTPEEEAFMIDKKTTSLFKIQPLSNSFTDRIRGNTFSFAFEQKLNKSFSISPIINLDISNDIEVLKSNVGLGVEFRYYHKLSRLIKEKKQANNLSSNYFASSFHTNFNIGDNVFKKSNSVEFSYGVQKRFLNYGYLDFSVNLGMNRFNLDSNSGIGPFRASDTQVYYLSTETNVGIGFGKRYEITEEAKCPIFRCFSNRRSAFKLNLNKTWSLVRRSSSLVDNDITALSMNPNIAYEIKLGKSPISFEQDLDIWITFSDYRLNNNGDPKNRFGFDGFSMRYRAGLKYYHSLKSRIRNGKSGNNLSGVYIFGRGEFRSANSYTSILDDAGNTELKRVIYRGQGVQLGYGYQKEVLKNLFYDISLGISKGFGEHKYFSKNLSLVSDIKVGIMF